jgi:hypothetical protein
MEKPRAYKEEEVRERFLSQIRLYASYWVSLPDKSVQERCEGLAFSILNIFDGTPMGLPAMDIVLRPHEDDKDFRKLEGENWYEDGQVINNCMLHELIYRGQD